MGLETPKQFLKIGEKYVIKHTIQKFVQADPEIQIIVACQEKYVELCNEILSDYQIEIALGGINRFQSVKNALLLAKGELIAVHDAVRPLVSVELIQNCFHQAEVLGAVIPVIEVADSLRKITFDESKAVNRQDYRIVQTPQVFQAHILKIAYEQDFQESFTDDATVVESCGHDIHLVEGDKPNFKITTELDRLLVECLLIDQVQ